MRIAFVCLTFLLPSALFAADKQELKLNRVALFSSGVGFFEQAGDVEGDATAELAFRTEQINDILKSLIVRDLDGGTVGAVGYSARDPIEKTLRSFAVDITGKPTLGQLLDQLRGEPVEISGSRAIVGVILGVEKQRQVVERSVVEIEMLNVLTDAGIQQLKLSELGGVKLTNDKVAGELRKALATLASGHDADKKTVELRFNGKGKRRVRASYLLETPIWKTSYRLALGGDKAPYLQGWATVENATESDWKDVQLSLVSGRPISFIMDLYTPLYVPRPIEQLELYASLRPPEMEAGFGGGEKSGMARRNVTLGKMLAPASAAPAEHLIRGRSKVAMDEAKETLDSDDLRDSGVASVAAAREAGELFEYRIEMPVSIARQHSAMLPIAGADVAGEKLSIYNPSTHPKHPLNGIYLENKTGLHLMQGPVTVFDDGVYAGDAKLPDLNAGEKRLLAYALDLAVEVNVETHGRPDEIVSLRIAKGVLWHKHKYVDERTYNIRNKNNKPRTVLVEQAWSADWNLVEPGEPFEKTSNLLRFKVAAEAGKTVALKVLLERMYDQAATLSTLGSDDIVIYLRNKAISPAVKAAMERVVALRGELDQATRKRSMLEQQIGEATQRQAAIRENLRTLQHGTDSHQRQQKKFDEIDAKIDALQHQLDEARGQEQQKREALETYLTTLDVG